MSRRSQPWLRQGRGWYVQHNGKQVFLDKGNTLAFQRFHELMSRPFDVAHNGRNIFLIMCFILETQVHLEESGAFVVV